MSATFDDICLSIKLVSGDSIICHVLEDTDKNIIINDAIQINVHSELMDGSIKYLSYYSPWFTGSDSKVHMIRKDHIISAAIPNSLLLSEYNKILRNKHEETIRQKKKSSPLDNLDFKIDPNKRFDWN
jgi:hypothetical protein